QPLKILNVIHVATNSNLIVPEIFSSVYSIETNKYYTSESFLEFAYGNFSNERNAVYYGFLDNGRFFQTPALFMLGMLLGRQKRFIINDENVRFWTVVLITSVLLFFAFYFLKGNITMVANTEVMGAILKKIVV